MNKKILLTLLLIGCCSITASAQQFALKTNALYWATGTINIGGELAVSKHSTVSLTANCNPWIMGHDGKLQAWFVQPEYRYWFSEKFTRAFVGVNLLAGQCEIGGFAMPYGLLRRILNNYYKANAVALGLSVGYDFYISPHWNLELVAGFGVARVSYHTVPLYKPQPATYKNKVRYLPVPTEIGVSFVYLFNSRK